jgi:hypothetical protein
LFSAIVVVGVETAEDDFDSDYHHHCRHHRQRLRHDVVAMILMKP